jgi:UDP-N-acetylglucosamine acyltransferase
LHNHVTINGKTRIGVNNVFYPNAVIGDAPQDLKYDGAPTETRIGYGNVFRENVTIHRGTELGGALTQVGNENLIMVAAHIAHDCLLGNRNIIANCVQLAGHVTIEDNAVIEALVGINQFVTVGQFSYVAATTPVRRDVPPFMKFSGDPNEVRGVNEVGLRRNGCSDDDINALKDVFRTVFRSPSISASVAELAQQANLSPLVAQLCEFMQASCATRFGRMRETSRADVNITARRRSPHEVRVKDRRKAFRSD